MSAEKLSVSLEAETVERARRAAEREGIPLSRWLNKAARQAADLEEGRIALEEHFAEFGAPSLEAEAHAERVIEETGIGRPIPGGRAQANQAALAHLDRLDEEVET